MDANNHRFKFLPQPLVLGDPLLDSQHDDLLKCLHALKALPPDAEAYRCNEIISELSARIVQHFEYEESVMQQLQIPEEMLRQHEAAHQEILDEMANLHLNSMLDGYASAASLVPKVSQWVLNHHLKFDLSLRPFLEKA